MDKIIACDIHDYFEIACMRRSAIRLFLHSGLLIEGQARDVLTKEGKEFLVLTLGDPSSKQTDVINLMDIKEMTLLDESKVIQVS